MKHDLIFVCSILGMMVLLLATAFIADKAEHQQELEKLRIVMECKQ